jgi:hypothetical protein
MPRNVTRIVVCLCLATALLPGVAIARTAPSPAGQVAHGPGTWPILPRPTSPPDVRHYVSWPVLAQSEPSASVPAAPSAGNGVSAVAWIGVAGALALLAATFSSGVLLGRRRARIA